MSAATLDGDARCLMTDLPMIMCSHCRGLDPDYIDLNAEKVPVQVWIKARFPGRCSNCGRRWQEGAAIGKPAQGYGHSLWVCLECGS